MHPKHTQARSAPFQKPHFDAAGSAQDRRISGSGPAACAAELRFAGEGMRLIASHSKRPPPSVTYFWAAVLTHGGRETTLRSPAPIRARKHLTKSYGGFFSCHFRRITWADVSQPSVADRSFPCEDTQSQKQSQKQ